MSSLPSFSIVINTLNRGRELQKTLESFRWLKYSGEFEVVVVNGPSTDNSADVISSWLPKIRAGTCDVANLSVSRNIGICMAQGDIVAFIDDDAIPEPEWLTQLAEAYSNPDVGGAGGLVYNHTGYDFQYRYALADRFGNADMSPSGPTPHRSFPKSEKFPHLLGCNASFRRSVLLEIGGFDEEYEYYLDETDLCLRIVDAGYILEQLPSAYVHHKFAPSNIRGSNKVARYRYPIIKNKIYFSLKHASEFYAHDHILREHQIFIENQRNDVNWAVSEKFLSESDLTAFNKDLERALEVGLKRGPEGVLKGALITPQKIKKYAGDYLPFTPIDNTHFKTIVLISRDFPPNHGGGIATFNKDLAEALATEGNIVHVITQSPDINRVDFENGVWVHRMVVVENALPTEAIERKIPAQIWHWSATALAETRRIASHRKIDVVEAPIWDCEGVAFLLNGQWPLVTSLQTTLHFWLESNSHCRDNAGWMEAFGLPMLALEAELMLKSSSIRSISLAIRRAIEMAYDITFEESKILIAPLGMPPENIHRSTTGPTTKLTVLFVGRLEYRKGIDVLLSAIPKILEKNPNILFRILGDDTLPMSDGMTTYKAAFLSSEHGQNCKDQVVFEGRVNDDILRDAYQTCDVFVAPSRFESFGLVFLEAMRVAKPVIGCVTGGIPEIVSDNENGLLVQPGNEEALTKAILTLADSEKLRIEMGSASQKIFLSQFTSDAMARSSSKLYNIAEMNFSGGPT
jgi:glycogen(starch) synthase